MKIINAINRFYNIVMKTLAFDNPDTRKISLIWPMNKFTIALEQYE